MLDSLPDLMLDRAAIVAYIPHGGRMCLLERVVSWDEKNIRCLAISHRDAENPLREAGGLPVWAAIEYAAQASAVHGALVQAGAAPCSPRAAVLGGLKNVSANHENGAEHGADHCGAWLDRIEDDLIIDASLLHSDQAGGIYSFEISAGACWCLRGQFTLMYLKQT
jgi:predicted hotdog family 3-hydroxylacyl-ACP dehydratase